MVIPLEKETHRRRGRRLLWFPDIQLGEERFRVRKKTSKPGTKIKDMREGGRASGREKKESREISKKLFLFSSTTARHLLLPLFLCAPPLLQEIERETKKKNSNFFIKNGRVKNRQKRERERNWGSFFPSISATTSTSLSLSLSPSLSLSLSTKKIKLLLLQRACPIFSSSPSSWEQRQR